MTLQDLVTEAGIMAGTLAMGETPSGAEGDYMLSKANQMVDMWAADRLTIYRTQRKAGLNLVAGTQSYTIGTGATWDVARPSWIDGAGIIVDPLATYPVELEVEVLTLKGWQQITVKTTPSTLPRQIWYDRTFASGFGTVYVYPVPSSSTPDIVLYLPIPVTEFAALTDTISLPPGYRMALVSNLAVILCLGLKDVPPDLQRLADLSLGQIKSVNLVDQMEALDCDEAVLSSSSAFNYYDGGLR